MKDFLDFVNERISIVIPDEYPETSGVIDLSFYMISQFHIYHLLSYSYSTHEAIGEFYAALSEQVDTLAESFIAIGGKLDISPSNIFDNDY